MGVLQPQQRQIQGTRQQGGRFPANEEDVKKFRLDIVKAIHSPDQQQKIIQALQHGSQVGIGATIGQLAGSLVMMLIQRRMVEHGVKVPPQLATQGAAFAIKEIAALAQKMGARIDQKELENAIQVAGQIIEQASQQGGQAQGQPAVQGQQPGALQPQPIQ